MPQLILPKGLVQNKPKDERIIRTCLNAPLSTMKKLYIPIRNRDEYLELAKNKEWCNKNMIGFILFISDDEYARLQRRRAAVIMKEKGMNLEGVVE